MEMLARVRVSGPLACHVAGFAGELAARGYGERSVVDYVRSLMLLSRWLDVKGLDPAVVDEALVAEMLDAEHAAGRVRKTTPASMRPVLAFLRSIEVVPPAPVLQTSDPVGVLLEEYRDYLVVERGFAAGTLAGWLATARRFVTVACGDDPALISELSAADVTAFVMRLRPSLSASSVNTTVSALRGVLRWFQLTGRIDTPLAQAAPWLAGRRPQRPPRAASADEVAALLGSCDRETLSGARAFAVLCVLARLGLRAGEVAAMELGDIDWRRAELTVRGKGGSRDRLPLPVDVGDALAAYLMRRGPSPDRHVFVRLYGPTGPMTMWNVRHVVADACARAGIDATGVHRLRHGAAVAMLAGGAPLAEIGQVLRHRDQKTTAIYARVDMAALSTVARPWPGAGR